MEALCGRFSLATVDRWSLSSEDWVIYPGKFCRIDIGRDTLLEGYVDQVNPSIQASNHMINVVGRDKTADLVDCSAPDDPGTWNNIDMLRLAQSMATPFGINVVSEVGLGSRFPKWSTNSGESVFDALSRAALKRHVLLLSGRVGNLIITNAGSEVSTDRLVMGQNVLSASGDYDYSNRFSDYIVKGQDRVIKEGWDRTKISIKGEADDDEIERHRPKIIKGQGILTRKAAENQARWEANVRAAKSLKATVTVAGFRQSSGDLWEMNRLVNVDIPELLLFGSMLISAIEYAQGVDSGSITTMELTRPDAYTEEPPKTVKRIRNVGSWG